MIKKLFLFLSIFGTQIYAASFSLPGYQLDGTLNYNSIDYQVWRTESNSSEAVLVNSNDTADQIYVTIPVCRKPGLLGFPNPAGLLGTYSNNQQETCFVYKLEVIEI